MINTWWSLNTLFSIQQNLLAFPAKIHGHFVLKQEGMKVRKTKCTEKVILHINNNNKHITGMTGQNSQHNFIMLVLVCPAKFFVLFLFLFLFFVFCFLFFAFT